MPIPKIGFIGAGKVGFTLGRYFASYHIPVSGYYSKSINSSKEAADFTESKSLTLEEVIRTSDLLFLTVPDSLLQEVWNSVRSFPLDGKEICHCSGLFTSTVFQGIETTGALGFSLHPLSAIHDRLSSYQHMENVYLTLEGPQRGKYLPELLAVLKNPVERISTDRKVQYHAAAVFCSNLVTAIAKIGSDLFQSSGLSEEFSDHAWRSLFIGNAQNIIDTGLLASLTGPIERGDEKTVMLHMNQLQGAARDVYLLLSQELLSLAKTKNPDRSYSKIEEVLMK
jgi:predicted short-subunit dehydrogenase-like oxidoreductase (DUF2520 family)